MSATAPGSIYAYSIWEFNVAAIDYPEPTTLSLLALGGLGMLRRRRRARRA
jgi:hypothetical protein